MGKYERYDSRYNERTLDVAVNRKRRWTVADEARLIRGWCRSASPAARVYVARSLGRTYVACVKRHAGFHRRVGTWGNCRAVTRQGD